MFKRFLPLALAALVFAHPAAASQKQELYSADPVKVPQVYPSITSLGNDGIQIENKWPSVITLARVSLKDKKTDQSFFTYSVEMQGINITGKAYPEMYLHFPGKGFFFSRGLDHPLEKDGGWQTYTTPFTLKAGEQPDEAILNLHFDGVGILRVRNIKLTDLQGAADKPAEEKTGAAPAAVPSDEKADDKKPAAEDKKAEEKAPEKTEAKPEEKSEEKAEKSEDRD